MRQTFGGRHGFLDERGIPLRELIHLRDGLVEPIDARPCSRAAGAISAMMRATWRALVTTLSIVVPPRRPARRSIAAGPFQLFLFPWAPAGSVALREAAHFRRDHHEAAARAASTAAFNARMHRHRMADAAAGGLAERGLYLQHWLRSPRAAQIRIAQHVDPR
jgi:hypothetical protein